MSESDAKVLIGKTIKMITSDDNEVVFETEDNEKYRIFTNYPECAFMETEDRLDDLIGTTISEVFVDWTYCGDIKETRFIIYGGDTTRKVEIRWFGEYTEKYGILSEIIDFEKV